MTNATHIHKPTGKPCRIISTTKFASMCDFGPDVSDPFCRVDNSELVPMAELETALGMTLRDYFAAKEEAVVKNYVTPPVVGRKV